MPLNAFGELFGKEIKALRKHLAEHPEWERDYRTSARRPSSIAIEVRKDLLFGLPDGTTLDNAALHARYPSCPLRQDTVNGLARILASAVRRYVLIDQDIKAERSPPWLGGPSP